MRLPSPRSGTQFLTSLLMTTLHKIYIISYLINQIFREGDPSLALLLMTTFCNLLVYNPMRFLTSFRNDTGTLYGFGREAGAFRKRFGRVRKIPAKRSCFPPPLDKKNTLSFRMKPNLSQRWFGVMRNLPA